MITLIRIVKADEAASTMLRSCAANTTPKRAIADIYCMADTEERAISGNKSLQRH